MRISRLILSGAAIGTIIGTGRADLNASHVFNPAWPPHARFHNATGWGTVTGSQLLALWLLWRPGPTQVAVVAVINHGPSCKPSALCGARVVWFTSLSIRQDVVHVVGGGADLRSAQPDEARRRHARAEGPAEWPGNS